MNPIPTLRLRCTHVEPMRVRFEPVSDPKQAAGVWPATPNGVLDLKPVTEQFAAQFKVGQKYDLVLAPVAEAESGTDVAVTAAEAVPEAGPSRD